MTQVYLVNSVKDVLADIDPTERKTLEADLQKVTDAPRTKVKVADKEYEAAEVSHGWVAVYRDLEPNEAPTRPYERAVAVMDLVRTDEDAAVADPCHNGGQASNEAAAY
jgi:hypothetical protein